MSEIPPPSPADDSHLADMARQWREVFSDCEAGLRAFLGSRLGQQVDVEDCLQVVCVKMLERGHRVAPAARRAWLFRVAANEAAGIWRRKAVTDRALEKQARALSEMTDHEPTDQAIHSETTGQLYEALQKLPDSWQQVVRLRINENLTFQQIADQLDIPLGTALTQMRRALDRLRSELETDQS